MDKELVIVVGKDPLEETGGGHSSYVRAHARAAIRAGFRPHLFGVGDSEGIVETDYGVVHRLRSPLKILPYPKGEGVPGATIPWHEPVLTAGVTQFLHDREGPRLIHGFGPWSGAAIIASRRLNRRGVEAIAIVSAYNSLEHEYQGRRMGITRAHGGRSRFRTEAEYQWIKHIIGHYERRAYFGARVILYNYESVRRILLDRFGPGMRFRKLPYSSERAFTRAEFGEWADPPGSIGALEPREAPLIVAISRHDARKGVDVLLRALAKLRERNLAFRACLVGGGMLIEQHRRLAERLNLDGAVAIEGTTPDSYAYLRHADVFALPSLEESSGSMSMLEALQAGVAVVASAVDGIPEDVTDGDSALLVEPGNVDQLSLAIERLLSSAELRGRLQRRARETFVEKFSAEMFTAALSDLYAELGFKAGNG
jgi:glycosyltransferase involved in cell wall biosynthesis